SPTRRAASDHNPPSSSVASPATWPRHFLAGLFFSPRKILKESKAHSRASQAMGRAPQTRHGGSMTTKSKRLSVYFACVVMPLGVATTVGLAGRAKRPSPVDRVKVVDLDGTPPTAMAFSWASSTVSKE